MAARIGHFRLSTQWSKYRSVQAMIYSCRTTPTRGLVFLGMSGSGKTTGAKVLVEQLVGSGRRVCILDPQGVWWGLRSISDGSAAGLPMVVFGGRYGDIPLERTSGAAVADLVIDDGTPVILDLSGFEDDESLLTVAADFVMRLRHRQNRDREPVHLVIDEADLLAPQTARRGAEDRSQRAIRNVARRSRADGLGLTCITQRPVGLHTDVLNMAEAVFLLRLAGFNDLSRIQEWIGALVSRDQRDELMAGLPTLADGEAFAISPQWIRIFQRFQFRAPATFDSSATPKSGASRGVIVRSQIDLVELSARFSSAIAAEAESDVGALRASIADLRRQMEERPGSERIEVPILPVEHVDRLQAIADGLTATGKDLVAQGHELLSTARTIIDSLQMRTPDKEIEICPIARLPERKMPEETSTPSPAPVPPASHAGSEKLAKAERLILTVLAQFPRGLSKSYAAILTGYAAPGGGFGNSISSLRTRGLLAGAQSHLTITAAGLSALGHWTPRPTGNDLVACWVAQLGKAEGLILKAVCSANPRSLTRQEIAEQAGYEASGGGFGNALSHLRTLELITRGTEIKASQVFSLRS